MLLTFRISPRRAYSGECFDGGSCPWRMGGNSERYYIMKAFTTHCLRPSEIWKISQNSVLNLATVDVPVGMIIHTPMTSQDCIHLDAVIAAFIGRYIISAWALALSVQLNWAFPEPQNVERTTKVPRFFCICTSNWCLMIVDSQ